MDLQEIDGSGLHAFQRQFKFFQDVIIILCLGFCNQENVIAVIGYQIWAYNLFKGKVTKEDLAYEEAY